VVGFLLVYCSIFNLSDRFEMYIIAYLTVIPKTSAHNLTVKNLPKM